MNKHSNFLLAKCFAAYYGSAIYKDGVSTGISGNIIDSIMRFGNDGWQIKLKRLSSIEPEHAQRLLEIRTGLDLTGCKTECTDCESYVVMAAIKDSEVIATDRLYYQFLTILSDADRQYLLGEGYDMGYSYIPSLIEDGIGIDVSDTTAAGKLSQKTKVERTIREEVLANLKYCSNLAISSNEPAPVGLINLVIAAIELHKEKEILLDMGPIIQRLKKDADTGYQAANN